MRGRELGRSGLGGAGGIPGQGRVLPSPARTRQPPRCRLLFLLLCSAQAAEAFGVFLNWFIWFCSVPPLLSASCIVGLAEPRFHWGFCPYSRLRSARCDACASPEPTPCWGISERVIGAGEEASIPGGNYARGANRAAAGARRFLLTTA